MKPQISLDAPTLRANARIWREYCGVPLRAVVKSDGYGWGFRTIVNTLEKEVDAFVVADVDEFFAVRALTSRTILTLTDVPATELSRVLDAGGIPNVSTRECLDAVSAWSRARARIARIRVGIRPSIGWSGIDPPDAAEFGAALAAAGCEVEAWTHVSAQGGESKQRAIFAASIAALREAGANIVGTDIESSANAALGRSRYSSVRLGAALFGFRGKRGPVAVKSALRVLAPVVDRLPARGQRVGYGAHFAPEGGTLAIVRCGYGDGFPRASGTGDAILFVGMQYTTLVRAEGFAGESIPLVHAETDLDALARASSCAPQEVIVRLGLAARAR
jgi:alanine racemase